LIDLNNYTPALFIILNKKVNKMKTILLILILTIGLLMITSMFKTIQAKTEVQKYETLYKKGDFEIRYYPKAILASVSMDGNMGNSKNSGFRVLAGYIFGGNEEEQKIAMTAPVRMSNKENSSSMSFVLPSKMEFENLPHPDNKNIVLHQSKPVYTASIKYGGYTSDKEFEQNKIELTEILNELGIGFSKSFEYLGYNPPYQFINRRNEVLVELTDFNPEQFQNELTDIE
jgi:hypothetical protein